ncbi:MAG: MFS transporter [Proteobacteria bacterium]|nr:MFS transporter [Pseudomonadota bacterium]
MPAAPASDVSREPFLRQIGAFGGVYWAANWMELVERFAYYGVRVVVPIFMVLSLEAGGPGFSFSEKGELFAMWALVQSFVPIFSGGFADRYGYKLNIAWATVFKIIGYLLMGFCTPLAVLLVDVPLAEARAQGNDSAKEIFYAGAMLLAFGTAIFKPGVQGLIANRMPKQSASLGWALFYQMVNIGGFMGPLIAGYLRVLEFEYVFVACSFGIALNFVPLLFFKEPEHHGALNQAGPAKLVTDALRGLLDPRLFFFTVAFAGFWLMFYQLFDILPNFINQWIDSRGAADLLASAFGAGSVPTVNGGNLTQEWLINLNALQISLLAFAVGYLTGKIRSLTAIIVGILVSAVGIYMLGMNMSGWWILLAIAVFSFGEMAASPTKMRYLASIAPPGKEGQYMGYVNMTVGIGWSVGSIVAGDWYEKHGDKIELARQHLVEHAGLDAGTVTALQREKVMDLFERTLGVDGWQAREMLWQAYEPYSMWSLFTGIGIVSMLGIVAYNWLLQRAEAEPGHSFNTRGHLWVRAALLPIVGVFAYACVERFSLALFLLACMFGMMLVASFFPERRRHDAGALPATQRS